MYLQINTNFLNDIFKKAANHLLASAFDSSEANAFFAQSTANSKIVG